MSKHAIASLRRGSLKFVACTKLCGFIWLVSQLIATAPARTDVGLPEAIPLASGWRLQAADKVQGSGTVISQAPWQTTGENQSEWWPGITTGVNPPFRPIRWYNATVPGTVLTSLVNDGVYPNPLYGENNRMIPDTLCRKSYWYRIVFTPPTFYAGRQVWLTFNGINYIAQVWVNSQPVGTIKGAFARGMFDITPEVAIGRANVLAVHILPPPNPGQPHQRTIAYGVPHNGGATASDGPTFLCTVGWDWIPTVHDRDIGIWQNVVLSATGPVIIKNPYVTSKLPLPRTDSADLTIQATVSNVTDQPQQGILNGAVAGVRFRRHISLKSNEAKTIEFSPATTPVLHLEKPQLWWPNGYGPQNLYTLHLSFREHGILSDTKNVRFGIRQITYSVPGSTNLTISVNGIPIIIKGGDWTMDDMMKNIPYKRLCAELKMHRSAHYTMIRNWVGQSSSEDFYDLCDRYGLLVWDEFWQPNPGDAPNPIDPGIYLANVKDKILRFRNHPCIALWCGRNEGNPLPNIGRGIQRLLHSLDPNRLYQPSSTSGRGVRSTGPYNWRRPSKFYSFHTPFATEVGVISIPTLESIHAMMPSNDWSVINDDWAMHDFCAGAQDADFYPYIISSRYGFISSLADFVREAQLANYEDYRAMYEGRFAKMFHPVTAILAWGSNPTHPSFAWQLYSHDLEPDAALFATREACQSVHIMMNQSDWHVMVVNCTPKPLTSLHARVAIYNLDGSRQYIHTAVVNAQAYATTDLGPIAFPKGLTPVHFVKLDLYNTHNHPLSDNFYWRTKPSCWGDYRSLNSLPLVTLDIHATRREVDDKCVINVTAHNPSRSVALMAHLQLRQVQSKKRVLPAFYSNNYLSLVPGETKAITIEAALKDLDGEAPLLVVDGWNVTARPVAPSGNLVEIAPNPDTQVFATRGHIQTNKATQVLGINCGGDQIGCLKFGTSFDRVFLKDRAYRGGHLISTEDSINVHVPDAAPESVYQTARSGECVYTIPAQTYQPCMIRLDFAETQFGPGKRRFNVNINGRRVLTNFDIAAEGGQDKAVIKDFGPFSPGSAGNFVIRLTQGAEGEPCICGIQILD